MTDTSLLLLLNAVKNDIATASLMDAGYSYSQIAIIIREAVSAGFLQMDYNHLAITTSGNEKLRSLLSKEGFHGQEQRVLPNPRFRTTPIGKYDIMLPKRIL